MSQKDRARRRAERERAEKARQQGREQWTKAEIAEAVHKAVCVLTRSDGLDKCHYYTWLGGHFLAQLDYRVHWQAGILALYADPADPGLCLMFDPELGRAERGDYGECHSWLAIAHGPTQIGTAVPLDQFTVVDFAARHYKRYAEVAREKGRGEAMQWKIADPPPFLWERADRLPKWVHFADIPDVRNYVLDGFPLRGEANNRMAFELVRACLRGQNLTIAPG
jgi:hypothetical protein